jgi:Mce-associated membrane protein
MAEPAEATTARGPRVATLAAAAVAALAVLLAAWYGGSLIIASSGSEQATAAMRDEVLREARALIVDVESIDYRTIDEGLDRRESWATGPLLAQFQSTRGHYADRVRQTQATITATVVDAAVTELDTGAGTAGTLVFVDLTTTEHQDGRQVRQLTDRQRLKLKLIRSDDGWKAAEADRVGAR